VAHVFFGTYMLVCTWVVSAKMLDYRQWELSKVTHHTGLALFMLALVLLTWLLGAWSSTLSYCRKCIVKPFNNRWNHHKEVHERMVRVHVFFGRVNIFFGIITCTSGLSIYQDRLYFESPNRGYAIAN
jgi:heme A synthase